MLTLTTRLALGSSSPSYCDGKSRREYGRNRRKNLFPVGDCALYDVGQKARPSTAWSRSRGDAVQLRCERALSLEQTWHTVVWLTFGCRARLQALEMAGSRKLGS